MCINKNLNQWNSDDDIKSECGGTDWLKSSDYFWTITPNPYNSYGAYAISADSSIGYRNIYFSSGVWPTLYLKSSVKLTSNPQPEQDYGTVDNPFQLSQSGM